MVFRRFSQHVRDQNWFAVGLDLLVVVLGIFIGLQVTEWNSSRGERKLEAYYLQRLLEDTEQSIALADSGIARMQAVIEPTQELARLLYYDSLTVKNRPRFDLYWGTLYDTWNFNPVSPTLDELKSTGRLALIRSDEVRKALARYEAALRWLLSSQKIQFEEYMLQYRTLDNLVRMPPNMELGTESTNEELLSNRRVYTAVRAISTCHQLQLMIGQGLRDLTVRLRDVVLAAIQDTESS